ncbi:hypothetical protein T484DRAFT_1919926 [Baffinella frigidus]|nr:hypothetical protein T484DRAFT_1919926 [Cryptophyta sp. CCMP2293]
MAVGTAITAYDPSIQSSMATCIDSDIAIIKEILAIVTLPEPAVPEPVFATTASSTAKAEQQARLAAKVEQVKSLALRVRSPFARPSVQVLSASLSVQSLSEYEASRHRRQDRWRKVSRFARTMSVDARRRLRPDLLPRE